MPNPNDPTPPIPEHLRDAFLKPDPAAFVTVKDLTDQRPGTDVDDELAGRIEHTLEELRAGVVERTVPSYVYVASSWRNLEQPTVVSALRANGIDCYDFRHPAPGDDGFSWKEVGGTAGIVGGGNVLEPVDNYLRMLMHPKAVIGYERDFAAMERADTFVLVLPCGRSAHLELGWAVGAGKRTAILLEDPAEPELMYRMVDHLSTDLDDLLAWMGVR